MKDVEKVTVERQNSRKRIRRRRRWTNLYALAVVLLVATAGITICHTFLFNIKKIKVSGESDMYSAEDIVNAAGVAEGDNLLRLDIKESEQKILDELLYVETASVKRKYPSSLEIRVTKCIPAFNVAYDGGTLLVSRKGKILADNGNGKSYQTNGLPVIYGYEPSDITAGKALSSENEHKDEVFAELTASLNNDKNSKIATLDMSDEFSIVVNYSNGMVFKMGSWSDVEYKLALASSVMEDEAVKGKKGYLTMVGTNQCRFRMTENSAAKNDDVQPKKTTDKDKENEVKESDPDQAAIFDEYNNSNGETTTTLPPVDDNQNGGGWNDEYSGGDWNGDSADYGWDENYGSDNNWDNGYYENYDANGNYVQY